MLGIPEKDGDLFIKLDPSKFWNWVSRMMTP